jgi:hypothetical protein
MGTGAVGPDIRICDFKFLNPSRLRRSLPRSEPRGEETSVSEAEVMALRDLCNNLLHKYFLRPGLGS